MKAKVVLAAVMAVMGLTAAATAQQQQTVALHVMRFYAPASGSTKIEGVSEVSLPALFAGMRQATGYRFEIRVLDSAGLELLSNQWSRQLPAGAVQSRGASAVEWFGFSVAPGRYRIRVRFVPDEGGTAAEREEDVAAFATRPALSDLLLAAAVRRVESDTAPLAPGEVVRGGLAMRTAPVPRLSAVEATLSYYAEIYPWMGTAATGDLRAEVVGQGGRIIVRTPARPVEVGANGGISRGSLDLTGLPEGSYRLRLAVRLADSTVTVEAPFAMAGLSAIAQTVPVAADMFATAEEPRLDSLYGPLVHLAEQSELSVYGTLSVEGKRRFLREFWRRRDPTPTDAENRPMADFYRAVAYVNQTFREGGAAQVPGWQTDRGRVYLRNGRWDEILQRPSASPRPYEVWKYTRERGRYYVFYDQSGFGHYALIFTNDRRETARPDWTRYLSREGTDDVVRFLGINTEP